MGFRCLTDQKIDNSFHHPRRITFPRVHPSRNKYTFFCEFPLTFRILTCNCDILTSIACQCSRKRWSVKKVCGIRKFFYLIQVVTKIRVCVREGMSEVHLIIVCLKRMREWQAKVLPQVLISVEVILLVNYVSTSPVPSYTMILSLVCAVAQDTHAEIIKTVWFGQV